MKKIKFIIIGGTIILGIMLSSKLSAKEDMTTNPYSFLQENMELNQYREENEKLNNNYNSLEKQYQEMNDNYYNLEQENIELKKQLEVKNNNRPLVDTKQTSSINPNFKATAYDLSVQSCGKPIGSQGYGTTASGVSLAGKTREMAMAVAVDPNIIPLGSNLSIKFPEPYSHFNGIYKAVDTGGAIKGNKIDLFMGDFGMNETSQHVWSFGVKDIQVEVL